MRISPAALLLLVCTAALGQSLPFSEAIPLATMRYGTLGVESRPVVASSGNTLLLVTQTPGDVRAGRLSLSAPDATFPLPIFTEYAATADRPAVTWTGSSFFIAGTRGTNAVGRFVDIDGRPIGDEVTFVNGGTGPRVAASGDRIAALYRNAAGEVRLAILDRDANLLAGDLDFASVGLRKPSSTEVWYDIAGNGDGFVAIVATKEAIELQILTREGAGLATDFLGVAERLTNPAPRNVAIASNGESYLAVWTDERGANPGGGPYAASLQRNGHVSATVQLPVQTLQQPPAIAWNGATYDVNIGAPSMLKVSGGDTPAVTATVTFNGTAARDNVSLASVGGATYAVWTELDAKLARGDGTATSFGGALMTQRLADGDAPRPVATAPSEQVVVAAASTPTTSFVAWVDITGARRTLRAGVRASNGSWYELEISEDVDIALDENGGAASSSTGQDFLLVWTRKNGGAAAVQVNVDGFITAMTTLGSENFVPRSLAWRGSSYALVGTNNSGQQIVAYGLYANGEVFRGPVVVASQEFSDTLIDPSVSPFAGFLVTYIRVPGGCKPGDACAAASSVHSMILNPDVILLDKNEITVALRTPAMSVASAGNDGLGFVLTAWASGNSILASLVSGGNTLGSPPGATALPSTIGVASSGLARTPRAFTYGKGWLVTWREGGDGDRNGKTVVAFVEMQSHRPVVIDRLEIESTIATGTAHPFVAGEHAGVFTSAAVAGAPYYGSERVFLRLLRPVGSVPVAPALSAIVRAEAANLSWSSPSAVGLFRVEYRVNDGAWREIERWFLPAESTTVVTGLRTGSTYSFRMRAWGSAGVSGYSNEARVSLSAKKRRS
jgi:hypothetical protein